MARDEIDTPEKQPDVELAVQVVPKKLKKVMDDMGRWTAFLRSPQRASKRKPMKQRRFRKRSPIDS